MRFTVVSVGKPRDAALAAAIREYEERAARYWPLAYVEVREEPSRSKTPAEVRAREAARLRDAVPKGSTLWVCDAGGKARTSEEFAKWLQRARENARDVALLIGGAFGIDAALKADAAGSLSLSALTFPHELARLVLAEQLYRAGTITRGEPYHK
jgi:23S rRNA (pseudouridine1915-N3)-methyltransferase